MQHLPRSSLARGCHRRLLTAVLAVGAVSLLARLEATETSVNGRWKVVLDFDGEIRSGWVDLTQEGASLRGRGVTADGEEVRLRSGSYEGGSLKLLFEREVDGEVVAVTIEGERADDGTIRGAASVRDERIADAILRPLPSPVGRWNVRTHSPDRDRSWESVLRVSGDDSGFRGKLSSERGEVEIPSLQWRDDRLVGDFVLPLGDRDANVHLDLGFPNADTMRGRWSIEGSDLSGDWNAERIAAPGLGGDWTVVAQSELGSAEHGLQITRADGAYRGLYDGELGQHASEKLTLDGENVRIEITLPIEGSDVKFVVEAKLKDRDTLVGKWIAPEYPAFGGNWKAMRRSGAAEEKPAEPVKLSEFASTWESRTTLSDGQEIQFEVRFELDDDELEGEIVFEGDRRVALREITPADGKVKCFFELEEDGESMTIDLEATVDGQEIEGRWQRRGTDSSGVWTGRRKRLRAEL